MIADIKRLGYCPRPKEGYMPKIKRAKRVEIRWISKDEAKTFVDSTARRVLGMSGDRFIAEWKAGKHRKLDSDACPGVIELALLAPLPRSSRARHVRKRRRK